MKRKQHKHLISGSAPYKYVVAARLSAQCRAMRYFLMSFLIIGGLFDAVLGATPNVVPTKEAQINLLSDIREVFQQVKLMVESESNSTAISLECDLNKMVKRAKEQLALLKELSLLKLACHSNSVCALDYKQRITKQAQDGAEELKLCMDHCLDDVTSNSLYMTNATASATDCGQQFLDMLHDCSQKTGLQALACYKEVIIRETPPVKRMLLGAIGVHREGHNRTVHIRSAANECVDDVTERCVVKMADILEEALRCK